MADKDKKSRNKRLRNRLYVFFICLVLSFFFWSLTKLSHEYSMSLEYPVVFTNLPRNKVAVNNLPASLRLNIRSNGFKLLSLNLLNHYRSVNVDLSPLKLRKMDEDYTAYLVTDYLAEIFAGLLNLTPKELKVEPDTLFFVFRNVSYRKFPVKPGLSLNFARQYRLYQPVKYTPDSIVAASLRSILDTMKYICTEKRTLLNVKDNRTVYLPLARNISPYKIKYSRDTVEARVFVERFTEARVRIPVKVTGLAETGKIKVFPDQVDVVYLVALKDFRRVEPAMFSAVADFSKKQGRGHDRIRVEVVRSPWYVKLDRVVPESLEYIYLK